MRLRRWLTFNGHTNSTIHKEQTNPPRLSCKKSSTQFGSAGAGASWRALGLKTAGGHSSRSLKISGCKRLCPKDLQVRAPPAPVLTHSLLRMKKKLNAQTREELKVKGWIEQRHIIHKTVVKTICYTSQ